MKLKLFLFVVWIPLSGFHVYGSAEKLLDGSRIIERIRKLSELQTQAEKNDDLKSYLSYYEKNAISMPEYQVTLTGIDEIEHFYSVIFRRQNIQMFQRTADEFIDLGKTIIEIGTFKKEYIDEVDTLITQNGKYWKIWSLQPDAGFKLKGEAFGFFHHVKDPRLLTVELKVSKGEKKFLDPVNKMPFELCAYNALMEKSVKMRDGVMRSAFFTDDGSFMPFAHPTVAGIDEIKPYLITYNSGGNVTIDSVSVYTIHCEYIHDIVLEYYKFSAVWRSAPSDSGKTEGKGIRIWKRQPDMSLRIFREIGTHNHFE